MHEINEEEPEHTGEGVHGVDWANHAADLIMEDLQGRKGVGNELDHVDADIVPYLPTRPFESIISRTSIDQHGLRFPEQLETMHAFIEPLNKGMFIDIRLRFNGANHSAMSLAANGDTL